MTVGNGSSTKIILKYAIKHLDYTYFIYLVIHFTVKKNTLRKGGD